MLAYHIFPLIIAKTIRDINELTYTSSMRIQETNGIIFSISYPDLSDLHTG